MAIGMVTTLFLASLMNQPSFVLPGAEVVTVASGLQFTEGPCQLRDGRLIFSDIPANKMYSLKGDKQEVFREPSHNANGNTLDRQGRLLTCEHGRRIVSRLEKNGEVTLLAVSFEGKRLNSPNDLCVSKKGLIYFTDPPYGIRPNQAELGFNGVFLIKDGILKVLLKDFDRPNGIILSPDEKTLYVADTAKSHIRSFPVKADGSLGEGKVWASTPFPDGLRVDSAGRVWSASGNGVNVISPEGQVMEVIKFPQGPANLAFSRDGKTLFVTARTAVYSLKVSVKGLAP
jgi:sugar lactone lactonase YvrE